MTEGSTNMASVFQRFPWWLVAGAVLLPCIYVPTLTACFDFVDDGCLVYRTDGLSLPGYVKLVWSRTLADFDQNGPFRPITWAHWEAAANLMGPCAPYRRLARMAWAMLACAVFLWLLHELGIRPVAAVLTAAVAMWNPYRNEIWMGLGLTEAFAMPYALLALVSALRASRSERAWPWDLLGVTTIVLALGCKNTFAAVVPAQIYLRLTGGGLSLGEGIRRHGRCAVGLALTLLLPIMHYIVFKLNPHSGHYTTAFSWAQLSRMVRSVAGAVSLDILGPCLGFIALLVWWQQRRRLSHNVAQGGDGNPTNSPAVHAPPQSPQSRPAIVAGSLLLVFGIGIYVPMQGVAGRYAIPAVWGLDLWLAVGLGALAGLPQTFWRKLSYRRVAYGLLGVCLAVLAVSNLGKQSRYAARADLLWQALEFVEQQAPPKARLAWFGAPPPNASRQQLYLSEGIHFGWHLHARGRADISVQPIDVLAAPGQQANESQASVVISGTGTAPTSGGWRLLKDCHAEFWLGWRSYHCYVWGRM
jgi:hypothetical protein